MIEFIKANAGNIVVGFIVFAVLAAVLIRLIANFRRGKSTCGCGCAGCAKGTAYRKPGAA